ncbi:uncharacterized protein BDV17DRAFT_248952 [Aspergillus undulatus]|uniref:uncharacterized protein n=1 Tax=Aspergillus undulatus TaxID=1810928 RepID=UPI003CCDCBCD
MQTPPLSLVESLFHVHLFLKTNLNLNAHPVTPLHHKSSTLSMADPVPVSSSEKAPAETSSTANQ